MGLSVHHAGENVIVKGFKHDWKVEGASRYVAVLAVKHDGTEVEVCRIVLGATADTEGACVVRAQVIVDALHALAEKQGTPLDAIIPR